MRGHRIFGDRRSAEIVSRRHRPIQRPAHDFTREGVEDHRHEPRLQPECR